MFLAVYAQTGLFFCFFLPSGTLLFTGGMFIATGHLQYSLITVWLCAGLASVLGCATGYWFGRKTGPLLYSRKDSRFFHQRHLRAAETFYKKYGSLTLTIGLLFPIIRTFAPIVAGVVKMHFAQFLLLVTIGSLLWVPVSMMPGYFIGSIPALKAYRPYIMISIIVIVTATVVIRIIGEFRKAVRQQSNK